MTAHMCCPQKVHSKFLSKVISLWLHKRQKYFTFLYCPFGTQFSSQQLWKYHTARNVHSRCLRRIQSTMYFLHCSLPLGFCTSYNLGEQKLFNFSIWLSKFSKFLQMPLSAMYRSVNNTSINACRRQQVSHLA